MAKEREGELPPVYSAKDIEIIVWNRVLHRVAELGQEGMTVSDEDYSQMWKEEVRKIVMQIQERDKMKGEKFRKWMGISD